MLLTPRYKRPFATFVKKQHKPFQAVIEDDVLEVCANPAMGEAKVGDLEGILVHKFSYKKQLYLMAYHLPETHDATPKADEDDAEQEGPQFLFMDFYQIGSHENFYDDLKAYLRADGWYK